MLALALGCNKGAGIEDDSGVDTDTGADTGEDTGDTAPACDRFEVGGALAVAAGAAVPGTAVDVELAFVELTDGLPDGEVLGTGAVGALTAGQAAPWSVCIDPTPPASDLYVPDPTNAPDMRVASYVARFYAVDGSRVTWAGASLPTFLLWAEGTLHTDWADAGVVAGWNLLTFDFVAESITAAPLAEGEAWDVDAQLLFVDPPALTGTIRPDLTGETDLVAGAWNINRFVDNTLSAPAQPTLGANVVTVASANTSFALQALGRPPADHLVPQPDLSDVEVAFYMAAVWSDTNGDLSFQTTETMHANSTSATPSRTLLFVDPTGWRAALYPALGIDIGWNLREGQAGIAWTDGVILDAP